MKFYNKEKALKFKCGYLNSKLPLFNVLTFHVPIRTLSFAIPWLSTVPFIESFLIDVRPFGFRV